MLTAVAPYVSVSVVVPKLWENNSCFKGKGHYILLCYTHIIDIA